MCNIFSVICFSLFMLSLVKSNELKDESLIQDNVKVSNHHKVKLVSKDSEVAAKTNDNDSFEINTRRAHETPPNTNNEENEGFTDYEKISHVDVDDPTHENTAENSDIVAEDDISNTKFPGSLTRRLNTEDTDDDVDDENTDEIENDAKSGEVLIYTPNSKSLSQDVVLDLKARTGNVKSEENDSGAALAPSGEIKSRIGDVPSSNINMRSGYVPPDYFEDIPKPPDYEAFDVIPYNLPNSAYGNYPLSTFYRTNYAISGILHGHLRNYIPMFSPPYYKNINSREVIYPNSKSRENM